MIRLALEQDFLRPIENECAVRIQALKNAYGLNLSFLQFYADDQGTLASVMDGFCVLDCCYKPNDEWISFLRMHPDILSIHSTKTCIDTLCKRYGINCTASGEVLYINNPSSKTALQRENLSISKLHGFLSGMFERFPPFEAWYVDVSHRVRHGCCHIAVTEQDGEIISSAMSVAETSDIVLIGGVATSPSHRGKGLASKCIADLMAMLPQSTVLINPINDYAARLYKKIGFSSHGTWAEIVIP